MADKIARRGVSIFIDGEPVKNSVKGIRAEMKKLTDEQAHMTAGADDYVKHGKNIGYMKSLLDEHVAEQKKVTQEYAKMSKNADAFGNKGGASIKEFGNVLNNLPGPIGSVVSSISMMGGALKALFVNPLMITLGVIAAFAVGIGVAVKKAMEFQVVMSTVKAVSGATGEEMKMLKQNAKDLGATTLKTAIEVGQLQIEYAKLGFTPKEILKVTAATIDLSIATGESLARSAEVAGATLRGFGLDAKYAGRVVDTMAMSLNISALDLEKYAESMKYIAPVAKTVGVSLEEVTSMLAVLSNSGISGSMAGTAMRMILLKLGEESGTLTEKIQKLSEKGLGLADANDEVGQRAMTALLVLTQQSDLLPGLTEKFNNAAGSGKMMADIMKDNLAGDIKIANSAWDGFMLSIEDGEGVWSSVARFAVQVWTGLLGDLTLVGRDLKALFGWIGESFYRTGLEIQAVGTTIMATFTSVGKIASQALEGDFKGIGETFNDFKTNVSTAFDTKRWDGIILGARKVKELEEGLRKMNKELSPEQQRLQNEAMTLKKAFRDKFRVDEITDEKLLYKNKLNELKDGLNKELITQAEFNKSKKLLDKDYASKTKSTKKAVDPVKLAVSKLDNSLLEDQITRKKAHETDKVTEESFNKDLLALQVAYLTDKQKLYKKGTKEYNDLANQLEDITLKKAMDANAALIKVTNDNFKANTKTTNTLEKAEKTKLTKDLNAKLMTQDAYDASLLALGVTTAERRLADATVYSAEISRLTFDSEDAKLAAVETAGAAIVSADEKLALARKAIDDKKIADDKTFEEKKKAFRDKFGLDAIDGIKGQYDAELAELKKGLDEKLQTQQEYEKKVFQLKVKTAGEYAQEAVKFANTAADAVSAYHQMETDSLEAEKQKQLTIAGDDANARTAVETDFARKELELKKKQADATMAISIAQAVANGALGIAEVWAKTGVNPIYAGILTALLVGITAANIGTAVAQRNIIQNTGFYDGGFTAPGDKYKPVGTVHAGEFVATQVAVRNPNLRPMFDVINEAQRNGTASSLTRAQLSKALRTSPNYSDGGGSGGSGAGGSGEQPGNNNELMGLLERNATAMNRLNDHLDNGIKAKVSVSGTDGIAENVKKYDKLMSNT